MRFSIIIPNYNNGGYISECIDSVIQQNYSSYEILFIDDCSTDNSVDVLKRIIVKHNMKSKLKIFINNSNKGAGLSRNIGLDNARGQYILFLDSDDLLLPGALDYIDDLIDSWNFDMMTYQLSRNQSENDRYNGNIKIYNSKVAIKKFLCFRQISGYVGGKVIKRDIVGSIRFSEMKIGEDGDFVLSVLLRSNIVLYSTKSIYYYRVHLNSTSERAYFSQNMLQGVSNLETLEKKHHFDDRKNDYYKVFHVFRFRVIYARIEKMDKLNCVNNFQSEFRNMICTVEKIKYSIIMYCLPYNVKTYYYLFKYEIIKFKYRNIIDKRAINN